jgi:hypothetical protein
MVIIGALWYDSSFGKEGYEARGYGENHETS